MLFILNSFSRLTTWKSRLLINYKPHSYIYRVNPKGTNVWLRLQQRCGPEYKALRKQQIETNAAVHHPVSRGIYVTHAIHAGFPHSKPNSKPQSSRAINDLSPAHTNKSCTTDLWSKKNFLPKSNSSEQETDARASQVCGSSFSWVPKPMTSPGT